MANTTITHASDSTQEALYAPPRYIEFGMEESEWQKLRAKLVDEGKMDRYFERFPCVACLLFNNAVNLNYLPCGHAFCRRCLSNMLFLVVRKQCPYPAKCCEPLDFDEVRPWIDRDLNTQYENLILEMNAKSQLYCARKACSTFLPSDSISGEVATCARCGFKTCETCKQAMDLHVQQGSCPENTEDFLVLSMAMGNRWRRCPCGQVLEKFDGCNHVVCKTCGADLCYRCGNRSFQCECDSSSCSDVPADDNFVREDSTDNGGMNGSITSNIENLSNAIPDAASFPHDGHNTEGHNSLDVKFSGFDSIPWAYTDDNLATGHDRDAVAEENESYDVSSFDDVGRDESHQEWNNAVWWDYGNDPDKLRPRTADEVFTSTYDFGGWQYHTPSDGLW